MKAPSSRTAWATALKRSRSRRLRSASMSIDCAPRAMASSTKASRVPEVGGGPSTSIVTPDSDGSTSRHVLWGLATSRPFTGMRLARARKRCSRVSTNVGADLALAMTMPSKPNLTSVMLATPCRAHASTSEGLMRREALAISGYWMPTPAQNSLTPPPVPVLSTTGVLNLVLLPKVSATVAANGNTVEEPTMRMRSRASAAPPRIMPASAATTRVFTIDRRVCVHPTPCV